MYITCEECKTRYVVKAESIGPQGRTVKCAKCGHKWLQPPASEEEVTRIQEEVKAPPPPPTPMPEVVAQRSLPVVKPEEIKKAPIWIKAAVFALFLVASMTASVFYRENVMKWVPATTQYYAKAGLYSENGLHLKDINAEKGMWRSQTVTWISGLLANETDKPLNMGKVRIRMLDKDKNILGERVFPSHKESFEAGEKIPFRAPLPDLPQQTAYLVIDIGNKFELMLR